MYQRIFFGMMAVATIAGAQTFPRRAAMVGGGSPDRGQCTVEVTVDGAAEVEIRGDTGVLRNLSGQQPQWRRFECTGAMPPNPGDFHFAGVDGRGKQELIRDPRNGGAAVVRIADSDNGAESYTFTLSWGDRGPFGGRDDRGFGGDPGRGFGSDPGHDRGPVPAPVYRDPRVVGGDSFYRDRDDLFRGNRWRASFFQRVRQDLDHATSGAFPFTGDRARLVRTQMQLDELQRKLSAGFYDERELDEVIGSLQVVMQANRLDRRDRAILADDLNRLRDFRIRHDDFGARDIEGVYHRERAERFSGNNWRAAFFQHIREDLDHVDANTFPFGRDESRLARTKFELDELQQKLAQGIYDERELDEAMGALQMVVNSNRLGVRDREVLSDDLARMREFRMRHEQFGAR
jgi:hypothetical protein